MAVRRERVILELQDDFSPGMMRAAAATALLDKNLAGVNKRSTAALKPMTALGKEVDGSASSVDRLNQSLHVLDNRSMSLPRSMVSVNRNLSTMAVTSGRAERSINQLTGRLRLFADLAAILGPGLVPLGALTVPALGGLANQLGVAALAGGATILAFQGMGDALEALNEARLEPTVENIAKAREEMEKISPAAQGMAVRLSDLRPVLAQLRDASAEGLFPGMIEGIDSLEQRLPDAERILTNISTTFGQMLAEGGESLASERWDEFFDFLATDATDTLRDLGVTVGSFTHGLAEMWMAFDPLNDDFSTWLRRVADDFDNWAQRLSQTEGFQGFVEYIRTSGPQVASAFGAMGDAILQILEAMSPLGGPVLASLEAIADVVSAIADSDLGTPIMAGVAALALFNRTAAVTRAFAGSSGGIFATKQLQGSRKALQGVRADVDTLASSWMTAGATTERQAARTAAATKSLRANLGTIAGDATKAGAAVGGLAVLSTGAADGIGLTNTASLALMGTLAGPLGTALGGAVGAVLDLRAANNDLEAAIRGANAAAASSDLSAMGEAQRELSRESGEMVAKMAGIESVGGPLGAMVRRFVDNTEDAARASEELNLRVKTVTDSYALLGIAFGETFTDEMGRSVAPTLEELTEIALRAEPAMAALGITTRDLENAYAKNDGSYERMRNDIESWTSASETASGRSAALADALADLDNNVKSTATSAEALEQALNSLLSPGMNRSAALDQWRSGLRNLNEELAENGRSLTAQTDSADQNRAAIRGQVSNLTDLMVAQANAGAGTGKLTKTMEDGRKAIIDAGVAAGLSRKEMRAYVDTLGLTPEAITTIVEAAGVAAAENKVGRLQAKLDKYGLTRATGTAALNDVASGKIKTVQGLVDKYGITKAQARALLDDQASGKIDSVRNKLNELDGKEARTRIVNQTINETVNRRRAGGSNAPLAQANGGIVDFLADGGIRENHIAQIAPAGAWRVWAEDETGGEAYIPLAASKRERSLDIWEEVGARLGVRLESFADGGTRGGRSFLTNAGVESGGDWFKATKSGLDKLEDALKSSEKSLTRETTARDRLASALAASEDSARSALTSNIFEQSDNIWNSNGNDPLSALRGDIADANSWTAAVGKLSGAGVKGNALDLLMAEGDLGLLQEFAGKDKAYLSEYSSLIAQRDQAVGAAATSSGEAAWGKALDAANLKHDAQLVETRGLRKEVRQLKKAIEENADAVGNKINKTASGAQRSKKRAGNKK